MLFVDPGEKVYAGQVVGEHNGTTTWCVNITRLKHLTNMRASSKEATVVLKTPRRVGLEAALEYIEDDEIVEIHAGRRCGCGSGSWTSRCASGRSVRTRDKEEAKV